MLIRSIIVCVFAASVGACSLESQENFDAKPFEVSERISRNYQAAYADVVKGARNCWGVGPALVGLPNAYQLDAQLFPELGYGEVYSYTSGTVFMPQALVRIEKNGSGATIKVKTGPQAAKEWLFRKPPIRWAAGDLSCK